MNIKINAEARLVVCVAALAVFATAGRAWAASDELQWDADSGVVWRHAAATVRMDRNDRMQQPVIRFLPGGDERPLTGATVDRLSPSSLKLTYSLAAPDGAALKVVRSIEIKRASPGEALVESFSVNAARPLTVDVEIERPFSILPVEKGQGSQAVLPLKNGWAKTIPLAPEDLRGEYRLGYAMTGDKTAQLALPVVQVGDGEHWTGGWMADPTFSALFDVRRLNDEVCGSVRYRYVGSRVPLEMEPRKFGVWLAGVGDKAKPFGASVDAFFELMLPDVPPGPPWIHDIAMVSFDFLSEDGEGFERDARALAQWLTPEERRHVALCLHGAYDAYGSYAYDSDKKRMKDEWIAFGKTRKVRLTPAIVRQRLRVARELGFRVLMYYASGMLADSGMPGFRDDWIYRDADGTPAKGLWQGPDTLGPTYYRNPAHPKVAKWYLDYMDAYLKAYGKEVDGIVFDETFHTRIGQIAQQPAPAYCDRAMLALVKELARRVHAFDPQKAFFASDCIGISHWEDIPGYAMMADGSYQDTLCHPAPWSYGLFPTWRNVLWSCNWKAVSNFHCTRWGVQNFGAPVVFTNGYYGDDRGPAEWTPSERDGMLELFRWRLQHNERVRFLNEDPAPLVASGPQCPASGDPLPAAADAVNWALATHGSRASASSEESQNYPAGGVIDGVRDDIGWGHGHGWASKKGERLPQWLQVDFQQPRMIERFVVVTFQREYGPAEIQQALWENPDLETAGKMGICDYDIQVWDGKTGRWETVVTEDRQRAAKVRVHTLATPVQSDRFRIVVKRVASLDEQARLLQLEAWGPANP